jgi:hypothetical protein
VKVITLTQPWASLVANGEKRIETRSWRTSYRGPLAIHAAKGFPKDARALMSKEPFRSSLWRTDDLSLPPLEVLPTGVIVATCVLLDCVEMYHWDGDPFGSEDPMFDISEHGSLTWQEREFGLYEEGRFAWMLGDVQRLERPIPAKGALGLWEFDV